MSDLNFEEPSPKFRRTRRGYSSREVDAYTNKILSELKDTQEKIAALKKESKTVSEIDEETLTQALGDTAVRLLTAAKKEASITEQEAHAEVTEIKNAAKKKVREIHERAGQAFKDRIEAAKAEADRLKAEALVIRQKTLEDMGRRRKEIAAQVERLTAGRDKLMKSFDSSQQVLNEIKGNINQSLTEAKIAADAASRKVTLRPELTLTELEEEVSAAKLLGLPKDRFTNAPQLKSAPEKMEPPSEKPKEETDPSPTQPLTKPVEPKLEPTTISTPSLDKALKSVPATPVATAPTNAPTNTTASLFSQLKKEHSQEQVYKEQKPKPVPKAAPKTIPPASLKTSTTPLKPKKPLVKPPVLEDPPAKRESAKEETVVKPAIDPKLDEVSKSLERQIKFALAQDQNQILDSLRQTRRKKELPPVQTQTATYVEAIDADMLSQVADQEVQISEELMTELLITPLRKNLDKCFGNEELDVQKEVRDSYRNFRQDECHKVAQDIAERILKPI